MPTHPIPSPDLAAFGHEVARRRQALGWSIDRLAAEAGVSRKTIMNIEHGVKGPRLETAYYIAAGLGISLADLVGVLDPRPRESG